MVNRSFVEKTRYYITRKQNYMALIRLYWLVLAKAHKKKSVLTPPWICFNDALLNGPDLHQALVEILWKFRRGSIALSEAIQECFHRIIWKKKIKSSHRLLCQRIESKILQRTKCVLCYVKNLNTEKFKDRYPQE